VKPGAAEVVVVCVLACVCQPLKSKVNQRTLLTLSGQPVNGELGALGYKRSLSSGEKTQHVLFALLLLVGDTALNLCRAAAGCVI